MKFIFGGILSFYGGFIVHISISQNKTSVPTNLRSFLSICSKLKSDEASLLQIRVQQAEKRRDMAVLFKIKTTFLCPCMM